MQQDDNKELNKKKNFRTIYKQDIAPMLMEYEEYRKKTIRGNIGCCVFFVLLVLFWVSLSLFTVGEYGLDIGVIIPLLVFLIPIWFGIRNSEKQFLVELKSKCLPSILKYFGNTRWCHDEKIISDEELKESGLFADYNTRIVDDEFQGSYKGVDFKISETNLAVMTLFWGKPKKIPVFRGVVFSFDLNKTTENKTIVSAKGDLTQKNTYWIYILVFAPFMQVIMPRLGEYSIFTLFDIIFALLFFAVIYFIIGKKQILGNGQTKLTDKVHLEDPKFNHKFDVHSSDQIKARFWVTPAFMERFQNLKTVFNAKKAKCSFYDNKIMIAIDTNKNVFEIGELYKSLENPDTIRTFCRELSSIKELIEYFKIHEQVL